MAKYDFVCRQCTQAPLIPDGDLCDRDKGTHYDVTFEASYRMSDAPPLGAMIECPCCKRNTAERIVSSGIAGIVKGHQKFEVDLNYKHKARIGGQDVNFTFVDHKMGDPELHRDLSGLARQQGIREVSGLSNARYDPKYGRTVVDVASNRPDPLGAIERSKQRGDYSMTKRAVNQAYKLRPKKKRKRAA